MCSPESCVGAWGPEQTLGMMCVCVSVHLASLLAARGSRLASMRVTSCETLDKLLQLSLLCLSAR